MTKYYVVPTSSVTLSSYNMGDDATEEDFDSWVSFVVRKIDEACGFEVSVETKKFGETGGDEINATRGKRETIEEALRSIWEAWCAQGTTFRDLARRAPGGIVRNDQGNGSAGPHWVGEDFDDDDLIGPRRRKMENHHDNIEALDRILEASTDPRLFRRTPANGTARGAYREYRRAAFEPEAQRRAYRDLVEILGQANADDLIERGVR